jgi:hypothetical protein
VTYLHYISSRLVQLHKFFTDSELQSYFTNQQTSKFQNVLIIIVVWNVPPPIIIAMIAKSLRDMGNINQCRVSSRVAQICLVSVSVIRFTLPKKLFKISEWRARYLCGAGFHTAHTSRVFQSQLSTRCIRMIKAKSAKSTLPLPY